MAACVHLAPLHAISLLGIMGLNINIKSFILNLCFLWTSFNLSISLVFWFPKQDSLSELEEMCFNNLRDFLNTGQASYPGFDNGGPRIQNTLHFPQCRNNEEIAGDNSWHRIACRLKNSW